MKKYIITSSIVLALLSSVSAEDSNDRRPIMQVKNPVAVGQAMKQIMIESPTIRTGDTATDAQIIALQKEMELKIKAIHDEYQAKIKAVIGDKKIIGGGFINGSSSYYGGIMRGSSTGMMMRREVYRQQENNDDNNREYKAPVSQVQGGIRGFLNRFFNR